MDGRGFHEPIQENFQRIDEQLDTLVEITGTNKVLAKSIGNELELQQHMLTDVDGHMGKTQDQLDRTNKVVFDLRKRGGNCAGWILVILLIIGIVVVWVVKF
jgi:thymidine phosphorylase